MSKFSSAPGIRPAEFGKRSSPLRVNGLAAFEHFDEGADLLFSARFGLHIVHPECEREPVLRAEPGQHRGDRRATTPVAGRRAPSLKGGFSPEAVAQLLTGSDLNTRRVGAALMVQRETPAPVVQRNRARS
jgi:hypothetical protein